MKIFAINTENWQSDGGAVFGVVPKKLWSRFVQADENNNINVANRNLLIKTDERLILFDTGMGDKQDEKFFKFRYIFGDESLEKGFQNAGFYFDEVTDVVFTHLHYDHCGGAVRKTDKGFELTFKNATHWVSERQWKWANSPNVREAASYLPENILPLKDSGKLKFITEEGHFCPGIELRMMHGHTDGQIIPIIDYQGKKLVFAADFIASAAHIPLPYIPSYDTRPLMSMKEKEDFLNEAVQNNYTLMFQHDYYNECCELEQTPKGIRAGKILKFEEFCSA
jgi:glyoxylase-like metal-dependent hydrolase (beta-lactamase superfamily II)